MECRKAPPDVHPIVTQTPQGPRVVGEFTAFPKVQADWFCGQHSARIETVADMPIEGLRAS